MRGKKLWLILGLIVVVIIGIKLTRTYIVSYYEVTSGSMEDTYQKGDVIFAGKWSYHRHDPQRGDVVIYHPPTDPAESYVHRIIGLPGEIMVIRDGMVYLVIDGGEVALDEPYLGQNARGNTYASVAGDPAVQMRFEIPANTYVLLGDNRMASFDSREFRNTDGTPNPFVSRDAIVGRVW